jgi:hypothetical protein
MNDAAGGPPDLSQSIADRIDQVVRAIVVPPAKGLPNRPVQRSGVLRPDGTFVARSITWRGSAQVTVAPPVPKPETVGRLPGRWLFLGPLFGHFGHFLVESIARIWAFDRLRGEIDGVLYVPKFQNRPEHVAGVYRPFLEALGVTAPMVNIEDPVQVDVLHVPEQGFGMFQMIEGAPEFRDFIRAHAGRGIAPHGPPRIYISRTELPPARGSILGERVLQTRLEAEGYVPFHPQKHDFATQIAAYKAATHVVSLDASPLHLLALVGNGRQKVGIIARRAGGLDEIFARQIRAFHEAEAYPLGFLVRNWIEEAASRPSRTSWGEVNFAALSVALREAGLITGAVPWPGLTEAERAAEVARIAAANGIGFRPYEGPGGVVADAD